ncbi:U7 snRNA-associated Sm-like protein LSm11 [Macrobrachium rosenbergii]|uniref:U7 snRNA-associated Sm-like protein LSm11 n=1 Tax=Macrobrachium rosenbergii TaxID=79674 RepID=UPI0034D53F29
MASGGDERDFQSRSFNPSVVLSTSDVRLPAEDAEEFEDLNALRTAVHGQTFNVTREIPGVLGPGGIPTRRVAPVPANRNFSEDQVSSRLFENALIIFCGAGGRSERNVLNRMEEIQGPLAVLRRCQQENIRVKVYTRNHSEIRGLVTGYVIAFDKHWNLALRDVDEVFQKKIRCKTPALGDVSDFVCIGDLTIRGREISSASEPEEYESEMGGEGPSWWEPEEESEGVVPSTSQASSSSRGHGRGGIRSTVPRGRAHGKDERQRQGPGAIPKKKLELKGAYSVESLDQRARASRLVSREHPSTSEARDAHRLDLSQRDRFEQKPTEGGEGEGEEEGGKKKRIRKRKKREIRTRHVNQLFIRGENVVLINVLEE